jgi:hypothetical protein
VTPEPKFVVFVDMLGFSALTEAHELDREVFAELQSPGAIDFLRASLESMNANQLSERFIRFHILLEKVVHQNRLAYECSLITFSDCAFFASDDRKPAISFSTEVMQLALKDRIPVRIGVAHGEFFVVRIKADFGLMSQDHTVQFLGTGVSRAHAAEHCGVKGLRILLHPSAMAETSQRERWANPLPLPEDERVNRAGVESELVYLWHPRHDDDYWMAIQDLRDASGMEQRHHYDATIRAVNRMRRSLDRPEFVPRTRNG